MSVNILIIFFIILCIVSVEAISWSYTIYNHCKWMVDNNIKDKRKISYRTISILSIVSSIFSFSSWLIFIYLTTIPSISLSCLTFIFILISLFQLITIHTWFLISSFICVPMKLLPFISRYNIKIIQLFSNNNYFDYIPLKSWDKIFENNYKSNPLIINFLDVVPDMVWVKDIDNNFIYVNKSVCKNLLLLSKECVYDKTSTTIAHELRSKGIDYTFGELCCDSDEITKERNIPTLFYEYGNVNGKFMALRVLKSPIYDEHGILLGTIGVARDVTFHIISYKKIENLIINGEHEKASSEFLSYLQHFTSMRDIKDLSHFKKGMR